MKVSLPSKRLGRLSLLATFTVLGVLGAQESLRADTAESSAGSSDLKGDWRQVVYSCASGNPLTVDFRASGSAVRVKSGDKPLVKLAARPASFGFRFGDSRHELRGQIQEVSWQIGSKTPDKCTSLEAVASG